jgi:hypothetical protein
MAVAQHPSCPPDVLDRLVLHRDTEVRQAALQSRNMSKATRAMWQLAQV